MRYDAETVLVAGEHYATLQAAMPASGEDLALRHASGMRAVLLAVRAWDRASRAVDPYRFSSATDRLARAQACLAKIEKEVSRG